MTKDKYVQTYLIETFDDFLNEKLCNEWKALADKARMLAQFVTAKELRDLIGHANFNQHHPSIPDDFIAYRQDVIIGEATELPNGMVDVHIKLPARFFPVSELSDANRFSESG